MSTNIGLTVLLWTIYFFIHSFLVDKKMKKLIQGKLNLPDQKYRLLYSLISALGLLPIFYFLAVTRSRAVLEKTEALKYVSLAMSTWGIIIIKMAFRSYHLREFLGVKHGPKKQSIVKSGLLRYVHHPLYSGTTLLCIGFFLFIPNTLNMVSVLCIFGYLVIGIKLEEKKLIEEFGEDYIKFKKEVPAVFPNLAQLFRKETN